MSLNTPPRSIEGYTNSLWNSPGSSVQKVGKAVITVYSAYGWFSNSAIRIFSPIVERVAEPECSATQVNLYNGKGRTIHLATAAVRYSRASANTITVDADWMDARVAVVEIAPSLWSTKLFKGIIGENWYLHSNEVKYDFGHSIASLTPLAIAFFHGFMLWFMIRREFCTFMKHYTAASSHFRDSDGVLLERLNIAAAAFESIMDAGGGSHEHGLHLISEGSPPQYDSHRELHDDLNLRGMIRTWCTNATTAGSTSCANLEDSDTLACTDKVIDAWAFENLLLWPGGDFVWKGNIELGMHGLNIAAEDIEEVLLRMEFRPPAVRLFYLLPCVQPLVQCALLVQPSRGLRAYLQHSADFLNTFP
ncbi:hypothetical protein BKA93DRAFT_750191 [Sparassis latifolia]